MQTVTINSVDFQIRKLPAYPGQLLLAKCVMPLVGELMPVIVKMVSDKELRQAALSGDANHISPEFLSELLEAAFQAMQKLSADDVLTLTQRALAAVQRREGQSGWSDIMSPNGMLMYQDLDLKDILYLIYKVVEVNLLGFFFASPGTSPGTGAAE